MSDKPQKKYPKVLVICSIPLSYSNQSRAIITYFGNWDRKNVAQIYFSPREPSFDFCHNFYKITDSMMFKSMMRLKKCKGTVITNSQEMNNNDDNVRSKKKKLKTIRKKTSLFHLARKIIWNKHIWNTDTLNEWIDSFDPDLVYVAFSNDSFILDFGLTIAKRKHIPLTTMIGDDYYFDKSFSISPFYCLYKISYKHHAKKFLKACDYVFYSSDKIQSKYNEFFSADSEVMYISSSLNAKSDDLNNGNFVYCGNLALDRYKPLIEISKALYSISPNTKLDIYSDCTDEKIIKELINAHAVFRGAIPYHEVEKAINNALCLVLVEDFAKKQISKTRYSLSTKVADYLCSGKPIFAYGPFEAGVISYLSDNKAAYVCTNRTELENSLRSFLNDDDLRMELSSTAKCVGENHHREQVNSNIFYDRVCEMLKKRIAKHD